MPGDLDAQHLGHPGGPEEDPTGNFAYGGWTVPFFDEALGETMAEQLSRPFDLLLGRKTFEIFAAYWPDHPEEGAEINRATKFVVSSVLQSHPWERSVFLNGDAADEVRKLKQGDGPDLQVHGSGNLIQTLMAHDLVDEFWLKIFPVTLGAGRRLFAEGTLPAALKVSETRVSPNGVVVAQYARAGDVQTGTF